MNGQRTLPRARGHPRLRVLLVVAALAATVLGLVSPASAAASSCSTHWGSLAKGANGVSPVAGATLSNVRAGRHTCYDRLVLDVRGHPVGSSWRVQYVAAVTEDASGAPVPLRGRAFLQITVGASDHTPSGTLTYRPADRRELVPVAGFRTFRQVAWAGSFEGLTTIGLGVRARLPFRVLVLPGPGGGSRVAVDVAHTW